MKKVFIISVIIASVITTSLAYCSGTGEWGSELKMMRLDVAPVDNEMYKNECSACHFAYQPGLLPGRSWEKLMSGLGDHFGDNAELSPEQTAVILHYLVENAADKSNYKRSIRITNSLAESETPLRITKTAYFVRKHHEISDINIRDNPEIGSFSNCIACHRQADTGSFNEHEIQIPGQAGRWED